MGIAVGVNQTQAEEGRGSPQTPSPFPQQQHPTAVSSGLLCDALHCNCAVAQFPKPTANNWCLGFRVSGPISTPLPRVTGPQRAEGNGERPSDLTLPLVLGQQRPVVGGVRRRNSKTERDLPLPASLMLQLPQLPPTLSPRCLGPLACGPLWHTSDALNSCLCQSLLAKPKQPEGPQCFAKGFSDLHRGLVLASCQLESALCNTSPSALPVASDRSGAIIRSWIPMTTY